jgi:N-acetylmuramic acid 6-phosphate etherase
VSHLPTTELRNPRTQNIDLASALEIVDLLNAEDRTIAEAVATQREAIARLIDAVAEALGQGGRLFYAGAGTSGRLGVLDASEMPPTFGTHPEMVQGLIAGGTPALTRSQEGAEDNVEDAAKVVDERGVGPHDVLIGIAASGTTPWVRAVLARAKERGATTGFLTCSPPAQDALASVDHPVVVITGPEPITGSTRMKAGTATKLVLNTITTGTMVRLGKTYGNLMVDLRATNSKLKKRSERIVAEVTGVAPDDARDLLASADGSVKLAIVMKQLGVSIDEARARLAEAGGVIRRVTRASPPPVAGS